MSEVVLNNTARSPDSWRSPAERLQDLSLRIVGVASILEFLPRQGLEAGNFDFGEFIDSDQVSGGLELMRL